MSEIDIQNYLSNGGVIFTVRLIDTLRDGGTIFIQTSKMNYYLNKDTFEIHCAYPLVGDNKLQDELHIKYLLDRIERYIRNQEHSYNMNCDILDKLKNEYQ